MKPFNLEKALAGEPVVTRDGIPATDFHYFEREKSVFNVCALVDGIVGRFTADGYSHTDNMSDLFMAPARRTMWGVLYRSDYTGGLHLLPDIYPTEEKARWEMKRLSNAGNKAIMFFPIELEE